MSAISVWRRAPARFARLALCAILPLLCKPALALWGNQPDPDEIFRYHRVSIVFAAQNLTSPISHFGHTFLVFHREDEPEPSALTVEFAGHLDGFADYLSTLAGGVNGQIHFNYLSYKERDYELEGRSLWIYELALSADETAHLEHTLVRQSRFDFAYRVSDRNCASFIVEAVAAASARRYESESWFFVTPGATVRWLRQQGLVRSSRYRPSKQVRALEAYRALADAGQRHVRRILDGYGGPEASATVAEADAVSKIADYRILREDDPDRRDSLFELKRTYIKRSDGPDKARSDPSSSTGSATASVMLASTAAGESVLVSGRPGFIGLENESNEGFRNATSEIGRVDVRFGRGVSLDRLTLFSTESYAAGGFLKAPFTQMLSIFYANYGAALNRSQREATFAFGRGGTVDFGTLQASILPFVSLKGVEQSQEDGVELRPAVRLHLYASIAANTRIAASIDRFYNPRLGVAQLATAEVLYAFGRRWGVSLQANTVGSSWANHVAGVRAYLNF